MYSTELAFIAECSAAIRILHWEFKKEAYLAKCNPLIVFPWHQELEFESDGNIIQEALSSLGALAQSLQHENF